MTAATLFDLSLNCAICGGPDATVTTHALNGLPLQVLACEDCRAAVRRRQVGVSRRADGSLSVTDGRVREAATA